MVLRSSLDNPETIPDIALNPSQRINIQSLDWVVPLRFASIKLAMPRMFLVLLPSVFLANLFSFASVNEQAKSMTPILATFSINASDTVQDEPNFADGVFIKSLV